MSANEAALLAKRDDKNVATLMKRLKAWGASRATEAKNGGGDGLASQSLTTGGVTKPVTLTEVLAHPVTLELLKDDMHNRANGENVLFLIDVQMLKQVRVLRCSILLHLDPLLSLRRTSVVVVR